MIQFHETGYGARFFNSQLPQLIEQLAELNKNIAKLNDNHKALLDLQGVEEEEKLGRQFE